jgi:Rrf2 family transcriptional regulator, iron-sulfur cluster assembly transcription factor
MRITLSRRGDYAVRAVLALAEHEIEVGEGRLSTRRIADRMHIPAPFASHVLGDLVRAGLVTASAGRRGGYRLAVSPDAITVLRVFDAAEGREAPPRCVLRGMPCDPNGHCAVHDTVDGAIRAARAAMDRTSMTDLVRAARS